MYHPTTRVLTVLELLQSHERMSARELAERLEVDPRTVRSYIAQLQDLGIPIEGERGRYGAYRLRAGYKLPPLMFSEDEAVALTLGLLAARNLGLGVAAQAVERALIKVSRVLPETTRETVQALETVVQINTTSPYRAPASATLTTISDAVQRRRQVLLEYQSWQGEHTTRLIEPYGVMFHDGRWYAAAFCRLREDVRVFRLDRVLAATPTDTAFERPADISVAELVFDSIARTPGRWEVLVVLHTTPEEAEALVPASFALLEPHPEGVLMRCFAQQIEWLAHFVLGLPCPATVLGPPQLRRALNQLSMRAAALADGEPWES